MKSVSYVCLLFGYVGGTSRAVVCAAAVRCVGGARRHAIAVAVAGVAHVAAALLRVPRLAGGLGGAHSMRWWSVRPSVGEVGAGPLPHVAHHIVQTVRVCLVASHRRRVEVSIRWRVCRRVREVPLEDVGALGQVLGVASVALREYPARLVAPRGVLPLGLGGEPPPRPGAEGRRVVPAEVRRRVAASILPAASGALWCAPRGAIHGQPPLSALHGAGIPDSTSAGSCATNTKLHPKRSASVW